MKQLGLSSTEVGLIYGVMPFVAFLFRPLFGALADKTRQHRLVLMGCILLTGISYCFLLVTPAQTPPGHMQHKMAVRTQIQCNPIDSYVVDCAATKKDTGIQTRHQCQQSLGTFSAEQVTENSSDITCSAMCAVTIAPMNLYACFTEDVTPSNEEICLDKWNSTGTGMNLEFFINDLSAVVRNEVIKGVGYNGINCEQYDLKNVSYNGHDFWQFTCNAEAVFDCDITCNETLHKSCISMAATEYNKTFWVFFVIFFVCNVFFSPVLSIVDAIAYDMLGDKRGRWGRQRLWGTVGFTLFAITSTFIMDSISKSKETVDYTVSFYIFLFLCTFSTIVTYFLKFSEVKCGRQMCQNMVSLLKYPKVVTFLLLITCFGIMNAVIEAFLFWYLQDLGSTQIVLGLCVFMNCMPEIVMLLFSGKIIKKIGHVPCFYLTALCYAARFFYYSFMTNAWYVLLIEPLHCVTFGLMYAAASSYASIIAPEGMSATVQGLVGGLQFGFGMYF